MCGIGGILHLDGSPVERARLERMRAALACRGPDDFGIEVDGSCGLVHTRLSVIDPATGRQPMKSRDLTLVFNGEIYNHRELRRELQALGHRFTTDHSDTETIPHAYRQWGENLADHLRGMYAFAIWDGGGLFLARDPVGEKPLYYSTEGPRFIFGSTVAAVRAGMDRKPGVNTDALADYLTYGYSRAVSLHRGIWEISCGGWMRIHREKPNVSAATGIARGGPLTVESAERLLRRAVERRLESDVPLGCFLSGGIDSSLVAAMAQEKMRERGGRLKTFSVSMPNARYDEGPWAKKVAAHIGAEHHELRAEPDVEEDLRFLISTTGEPIADSSILPSYWLSKAARRHVTVALSGDGGDELFGGYERYLALRLLRRHAGWLRHLPAGLLGGEQKSFSAKLRRLVEASRLKTPELQYLSIIRLFSDGQLRELGFASPRLACVGFGRENVEAMEAARFWDFENYLPYDLLRKVDRASMAVALEVRCPMLDTELAGAALATPMRSLVPGRQTKYLLRRVAEKYLPPDVVGRKKMGFAVPIGGWFAGKLKPLLQKRLLDSSALSDLGCNRPFIERLVAEHAGGREDHTQRLFALLSLSVWHDDVPKG